MDLDKALRDLYEEKKHLDRAIARLEERQAYLDGTPRRSTRGRKGMGPEERLKVSARMTAYWAARRAKSSDPEQDSPQEQETEAGQAQTGATQA